MQELGAFRQPGEVQTDLSDFERVIVVGAGLSILETSDLIFSQPSSIEQQFSDWTCLADVRSEEEENDQDCFEEGKSVPQPQPRYVGECLWTYNKFNFEAQDHTGCCTYS